MYSENVTDRVCSETILRISNPIEPLTLSLIPNAIEINLNQNSTLPNYLSNSDLSNSLVVCTYNFELLVKFVSKYSNLKMYNN